MANADQGNNGCGGNHLKEIQYLGKFLYLKCNTWRYSTNTRLESINE
jgi:hypothetical protein